MNRERLHLRSLFGLRARIWLVMLFVLLPALAYIVTSSLLERSRARAQAQTDLLTLARLAANGQQQSLQEMQRTLALTAMLAPVQSAAQGGDPAACSVRLAEVAAQYSQTNGFWVWNMHGDLLCADRPWPGLASASGESWFRQVLAQRVFSIGDFEIKDVGMAAPLIIGFGYPITSSAGQLAGVISTGLDLRRFVQPGNALPLPSDALVTVFDHNGVILARSVDGAIWNGKAWPDTAGLQSALANSSSVIESSGLDGMPRLYALTPVPGPGGNLVYLSIGRPVLTVYGPADTALAVGLAITGGLTLLALALAGWWSRQTMVRPLQGLLGATDRLARGDLSARAGPQAPGSEVDRLAAAINVIAASLERSESERRDARQAAEQAAQQAQRGQARAAQLEAISAGLSGALTPVEVMDAILRQGAGAVGASAATLLLLSQDGFWLRQAATAGYSDQISRLFQQFPVSSPLPASDAVRTGEAVWIESAAAYRARYPQLTDVINSTDYEAAVALPLRYSGRIIGVLALNFPGRLTFAGETQTYLLTLASFCAQALERARLAAETQRPNSTLEAGVQASVEERDS